MKKLIQTIIAAVICLFAIIFIINFATDVLGSGGADVQVVIPQGASCSQVIDVLVENSVIEHPSLFKVISAVTGRNADYKSGIFLINTGDSYLKLIDSLTGIPDTDLNSVKIVIPEGFEVAQIANAMEKAGVCPASDFISAASSDNYDFAFLKDIKNKHLRKYLLEGYLFPDTYSFCKDTPAEEVVKTMLSNFERVISEFTVTDIDDTIILASVIEREALDDSDRKKVSSVFHNRLKRDDYLSRLQSCATVQYILGERKAVLSDADTKIQSPYNTYLNKGLPVGPISNPGKASIEAALYPESTDYLYFGLNKDGVHTFSRTYNEHLKSTQ